MKYERAYYVSKRCMDVVLSSGLLLVASPFFFLIAVAIKINSKGPVFYRSHRVKMGGIEFMMLKFRSMYVGADRGRHVLMQANERDGLLFKMQNDPRVTHVGYYLRRYSVDEAPQLINVLLGDMSLVGPRPPLCTEVVYYGSEERKRLSVPQGMTGLWQVKARNHPSFRRYLGWDLFYVRRRCSILDLRILYWTIFEVFRGSGA
jgi:lipopolysaccharide/colanic/teichoic acid biosynthesis glycosyltransferase